MFDKVQPSHVPKIFFDKPSGTHCDLYVKPIFYNKTLKTAVVKLKEINKKPNSIRCILKGVLVIMRKRA